jgi:SAM-dependent methyltransferase
MPGGIEMRLITVAVVMVGSAVLAAQTTTQTPEQLRDFWNKQFEDGAPGLKNRVPNKTLVAAVQGRTPGPALDLGTGEGRNALFLAENGWRVTGVDISNVAIAQAKQNAAARKLKIETVVADLDIYDFGNERWDLITSIYIHGWHNDSRTDIPSRIYNALKPGGLLVIEGNAKPEIANGFSAEQMTVAFAKFRIIRHESLVDAGDWAGGDMRHIVRFVAEKAK